MRPSPLPSLPKPRRYLFVLPVICGPSLTSRCRLSTSTMRMDRTSGDSLEWIRCTWGTTRLPLPSVRAACASVCRDDSAGVITDCNSPDFNGVDGILGFGLPKAGSDLPTPVLFAMTDAENKVLTHVLRVHGARRSDGAAGHQRCEPQAQVFLLLHR